MLRYLRLLLAFARYGLAREMAFRANFVAKVAVEVLWLFILLAFYKTVFAKTPSVAEWPEAQYLFFLGCFFAMEGIIETFFMSNCAEFANLVRSGDLDFFLLKPIDEQFLITCRDLDWSTFPNFFMGAALMVVALFQMGWQFDPLRVLVFLLVFVCGTILAYSFMLMLTSTSVWFVRNQSLMEMWWLFTSLMRYPREIYVGPWASPLGLFFTFVIPILIVVNVPAHVMVKALDEPAMIAFMLGATAVFLVLSRWFFRFSLGKYRSASS
jgi:ABC-2 type transport system permease protein